MVRLSLRRTLGFFAGVATFGLFLLNTHTRFVMMLSNRLTSERRLDFTTPPQRLQLYTETVELESDSETTTIPSLISIVNTTDMWFWPDGNIRPMSDPPGTPRKLALFPDEANHDRIVNQIMYVPPGYRDNSGEKIKLKKILFYNGLNSWPGVRPGRNQFLKQGCPVNTCTITSSKAEAKTADAVIFKDYMPTQPSHFRNIDQIWILYLLECPLHTPNYRVVDAVNWTATYRRDSDIVAPYEKWVYYNNKVKRKIQEVNYSANKTKLVAWFVSNCHARNKRLEFAKELGKYVQVDIYGACGKKKCPRSNHKGCFDMLKKDYKFYLAFENSNCRDYVTEKFFINGLKNNIVPIAMGAPASYYREIAPRKSFIHVDDFSSVRELAGYLKYLDMNNTAYNEYFEWKGVGNFVNTYFFCRMCSMLHADKPRKHYPNINKWWRERGTCVTDSWRNHKELNFV